MKKGKTKCILKDDIFIQGLGLMKKGSEFNADAVNSRYVYVKAFDEPRAPIIRFDRKDCEVVIK